ncbi:LytTR family DNA-binding domain-containing protein [Pseudalkalibacillus berkeleyi]|uniref:LytTR family transcriptional regulator n=1 Tax=Pseudalkalibacillus berkeleyi TaxID=1069813 RepID=A0ABS9GYC2_9BACL|nr:LytTR family DNA-binding domain-containing protein [Pseudalkalibacillus berkeleyi]MCF6136671.1 LytTR family transcriptional regulator [Pseudalkalibacillus berkeleyi]
MDVHIDISEKYQGLSITVHAKQWSNEIDALVNKIKSPQAQKLFGEKDEQTIVLQPEEIDYIYSQHRKVFVTINGSTFEVKYKLYEIEKLLEGYQFSRFSKSVIGNLEKINRFEVAFNGNLCVYFHSGQKEYVSRKYVQEIKQKLLQGS